MQTNANSQRLEGRYSRLGSKLRKNDNPNFHLVVGKRTKFSDYRKGKPSLFLVAHGTSFRKGGQYISSLYQTGGNRYKFDCRGILYSILLRNTDAEITRIN